MKCMKSVDSIHIKRVSDEEASELYHEGWSYVSKSEWKEKVRDVETEVIVDEETGQRAVSINKSNKPSKAQKRHMRKANK